MSIATKDAPARRLTPAIVADGVDTATALFWFLLFGGLRSVRELQRGRRRGPTPFGVESDADALARLTGVPGGMWAGLFWLLGSAPVVAGAWVLVGRVV